MNNNKSSTHPDYDINISTDSGTYEAQEGNQDAQRRFSKPTDDHLSLPSGLQTSSVHERDVNRGRSQTQDHENLIPTLRSREPSQDPDTDTHAVTVTSSTTNHDLANHPTEIWSLIAHAAHDPSPGDKLLFTRTFPREDHSLFGRAYLDLCRRHDAEHAQIVIGTFLGSEEGFIGERIELVIPSMPEVGDPVEEDFEAEGQLVEVHFDPRGFRPRKPRDGGERIEGMEFRKIVHGPIDKVSLERLCGRIAPPGTIWSADGSGGMNCFAFVEQFVQKMA